MVIFAKKALLKRIEALEKQVEKSKQTEQNCLDEISVLFKNFRNSSGFLSNQIEKLESQLKEQALVIQNIIEDGNSSVSMKQVFNEWLNGKE